MSQAAPEVVPDSVVFREFRRHMIAVNELKDKGEFDAYSLAFAHLDSAAAATREVQKRRHFTFPENWSLERMAGTVYCFTGELYNILGDDMDAAIAYGEKGLQLMQASGFRPGISMSYNFLSVAYRKAGRSRDALVIYQKMYAEADNPGIKMDASLFLMEMYTTDTICMDSAKADSFYRISEKIYAENQLPMSELHLKVKGDYFYVRGMYDSAAVSLEQAFQAIENNTGNLPQLQVLTEKLIDCYLQTDNIAKLRFYYAHKKKQLDLRGNKEDRDNLDKLRLEFDAARRKDELSLSAANRRADNLRQWLLGVGAGTALLLSGVFSIGYFSSRRSNRQLRDRNEKIRLLNQEIHHRVKNSLQMLQSMLRVQARQLNDPKAVDALNASQQRVQSMAIVHQELFDLNTLDTLRLDQYLPPLIRNLAQAFGLKPGSISVHIDPVSSNVEAATSLGLLLNELITNTSKYGMPPDVPSEISIQLLRKGSRMQLQYRDNGPGFASIPEVESSSSLGMQIVSSIAAQLNGSMSIRNDKGAVFDFDLGLPISNDPPAS